MQECIHMMVTEDYHESLKKIAKDKGSNKY